MENRKTSNPAKIRIDALLDAESFVEIGGAVTARATDFNLQEKCVPSDAAKYVCRRRRPGYPMPASWYVRKG